MPENGRGERGPDRKLTVGYFAALARQRECSETSDDHIEQASKSEQQESREKKCLSASRVINLY